MARNPNILKVKKQKRQGRRAYLTSQYSLIKVPRAVGKADVPESSRALFNYRDRGLGYYSSFIDIILPDVNGTPTKVEWPVHRPISQAMYNAAIDPKKPNGWKSEEFSKYGDIIDGRLIMRKERADEVNGRRYTLKQAEELRLIEAIEDPDVCDYITLRDNKLMHSRLTFVFNRNYTRCFFIEVVYQGEASFATKSKIYTDRERALFDEQHKRIIWDSNIQLSSLTLVLPRRV